MKARITVLTMITTVLCFSLTAWTQLNIEQQVHGYFMQTRQGDTAAADKALALLKDAVQATPDDAILLELLGRSYFMKLATVGQSGGAGLEALATTVQPAIDAFDKALELNPDSAIALSGHG